jgi:hypothetical protein
MSLSFVRAETRATECEPLEGVVLRLMQFQCFLCRLNKYAICIQNMRLAPLSYRGELLAKFCVARTIIRRPFEHHQRHQHYHHQSHLHQHQYRGINDNSKYINTIINVTNIISNITSSSVPNTTPTHITNGTAITITTTLKNNTIATTNTTDSITYIN